MYKSHLKKTGMSKNLKASEAVAMSRVKAWRDARGITCEFWRNGKLVDPAKLLKFKRLHRVELEKIGMKDQNRVEPIEALLPPNIVALSPDCPFGLIPARLETTEKVSMSLRDFMIYARPKRQASPFTSPYPSSLSSIGGHSHLDMQFAWLQMERNSKGISDNHCPHQECPRVPHCAASSLRCPSNTCKLPSNFHPTILCLG